MRIVLKLNFISLRLNKKLTKFYRNYKKLGIYSLVGRDKIYQTHQKHLEMSIIIIIIIIIINIC